MKFLASDSGLVHETALRNREHCHTLLIPAPGYRIVSVYACSSTGAIRARGSRRARRDRNSAHVGPEFEPCLLYTSRCV